MYLFLVSPHIKAYCKYLFWFTVWVFTAKDTNTSADEVVLFFTGVWFRHGQVSSPSFYLLLLYVYTPSKLVCFYTGFQF